MSSQRRITRNRNANCDTGKRDIYTIRYNTCDATPANVSYMEEEEHTKIAAWFRSVEKQISLSF